MLTAAILQAEGPVPCPDGAKHIASGGVHGDGCLILVNADVVLSVGWDAVGEGELVVESRQEDTSPGPEDGGVDCGGLIGEEVGPTAAGGLVTGGLADVTFGL